MSKLRELLTNFIIFLLLIYCLLQSFIPVFGYTFLLPFNLIEIADQNFNFSRLLLIKSASLFTMALFIINFWRHRRPLSAIAPIVVICYSLVFFELLSVVTLQQFTEYEANIYLIIFFITAGGLLHFKNIKNSESIFSR